MPTPKEVLLQWVAAFNNADSEALGQLYAGYATNHQAGNATTVGRAAIQQMFEKELAAGEMACIPDNIFEDGEWAILEWYDTKGLRGCSFFHVVESKIVFQRGYRGSAP